MEQDRRIKIAERADMVRTKKGIIAEMVKAGNGLAELYRDLKIGGFTAETLADAFNGDCSKAKRLYREQAQAEADGFRSVSLRDGVVKEAEAFNTPLCPESGRNAARLRQQGRKAANRLPHRYGRGAGSVHGRERKEACR